MNDSSSPEPPRPGRRARPAPQDGGSTRVPRRGQAAPAISTSASRRATVHPEGQDSADATRWWLRGSWWAAVVAVLALLALLLWLVLSPSLGTSTAPLAPRVSNPSAVPGPSEPSTSPPEVVSPSSSVPTAPVSPQEEPAPPLPGTVPPTPADTPPEEPIPTATEAAGEILLNDAIFTAPDGWTLFGDDQIENARRVVRLSQQATDARLQAVTLEPSGQSLGASCGSLVDLQQTQFTGVTPQLVVPIGVDTKLGSAVRCGFMGVRGSDGVPNTVTFTLVSRVADSHVLMVRTTVPENPAGETPAVAQLNVMTCEASSSFGVALPLC